MTKHIPWIVVTIIFAMIVAVKKVEASDRHHDHQTVKTEYVYLSKDNESAKYVIGGAILTCAVLTVWKGRWCWEEKSPEPIPDFGPAVKDITPSNLPDSPIGVRLTQ